MLFNLEFPITRRFPWPYFTPIVLTVSTISLVCLTILNVRLAGYETITSLEEDFNITQLFWLDRIVPNVVAHGQSLCQPLVLMIGDSFVTNSSMFLWDLELVAKANHSSSTLVYKGSSLQGCDVIALYLNGNMNPPTLDVVAVISCKDLDGFDVIGKTAFPISVMPGTYTRFTGMQSNLSNPGRGLPYQLIEVAAIDLRDHIYTIIISGQGHYPVTFSAEISYTPCPAILGINAPCATHPPPVDITSSLVLVFNGTSLYPTTSHNSSAINGSEIYAPIANIIQTIHAAVQIDLGNPHDNNFLLNPSVLSKTLYREFPAAVLSKPTVSTLYQFISNGSFFTTPTTPPLKVEGPAKLEARYLCRLQRMKAPAQAFIAVLVATLSMFIAGWGMLMVLATYWAKRGNDSANSCVVHDEVAGMMDASPTGDMIAVSADGEKVDEYKGT